MTISSISGNYGEKTVKSGGKFISVSAEQVKAQAERRLAQAAEKAAKRASKTGHVTVFDATKNLHVSATPAEAKAITAANNLEKEAVKVVKKPGFLKKALKFGLIGLGIAGLVGGGIFLAKKLFGKKDDAPVNNAEPTPVKTEDSEKPDNVIPPKKSEENQEDKKAKEEKINKYVVKKGDCLWNIAKEYLIEQHKDNPNYKPTNQEILDKTEELMKLNDKEYKKPLPKDSRKRVVVIHENEQIKLSA